LQWLLRRSLRGGQCFARHTFAGGYGHLGVAARVRFVLRAIAQLTLSALLVLLTWPLGRHRAAGWLLKAAANTGKLTQLGGWRYREYAAAPLVKADRHDR
jgi:succinoglycan biosynthesis protein ExoM